jgi:hypothetical protein
VAIRGPHARLPTPALVTTRRLMAVTHEVLMMWESRAS